MDPIEILYGNYISACALASIQLLIWTGSKYCVVRVGDNAGLLRHH